MPDLGTLTVSGITDGLLGWFAETTMVASVLAALVALIARVRWLAPGPAARHALWLLVMIKLVTPPLIHWPWSLSSPIAATWPDSLRASDRPIIAEVQPADARENPEPEQNHPSIEFADCSTRGPAPSASTSKDLRHPSSPASIGSSRDFGAWIAVVWLSGSIAVGVRQGHRVARFRRLWVEATPAPDWLLEESERIGRRLGVRVPPIFCVPGLGTPVLWCLGRPVLLIPTKLLKTLEAGRWRSIVAHELAHLRRGDHWVRRLELAASLAWWWNPLYWLVQGRIDFEAELACDAWAVWASPADRLTYAESLIRIGTDFSPTGSPAPALGVIGSGRSFERRLTMILRNQVDRRVSAPGLLAASLLAALALPSWTLAEPLHAKLAPTSDSSVDFNQATPPTVADDDDEAKHDDAPAKTPKKATKRRKAEQDESEKQVSELEKEMEAKFGPDSEFAKKMEALGKEMEAKFGPGSEFVKRMEAFGKEMEAKFGPGSEFAKKIEESFGPDSESKKAAKASKVVTARAEVAKAKGKAEAAKAKTRVEASRTKSRAEEAKGTTDKRTRRIEALETRINEMTAELKKLKAESKEDEDDQG